jgi:hypothetical protein
MPHYSFFAVSVLAQLLSGLLIGVGLVVGLRIALPSLVRVLMRELDAHRAATSAPNGNDEAEHGRQVLTSSRPDYLSNGD